jgi:hypothetical protein
VQYVATTAAEFFRERDAEKACLAGFLIKRPRELASFFLGFAVWLNLFAEEAYNLLA